MIFNEEIWHISYVLSMERISHDEFITHYPPKLRQSHRERLVARRSPLPLGWFKLNVDGSFIESTNAIGFGGLIRSNTGEWVAGFSSYDGDTFLAELMAIKHGLLLAWSLDIRNVICESNSKMW